MNFYKRHIGDYIKKAGHLTLLEHGIYSRLMDVYYTREAGIPEDKAARLIGARSKDEQQALARVLEEFFTLVDGLWTQNRCEEEIGNASEKAEQNRENGRKGGRPKQKKTVEEPKNNPMGFDSVSENNLSQTPDSRLQTKPYDDSTDGGYEPPSSSPLPDREDPPPSNDPAITLAVSLRKLGVDATFTHPAVLDWVKRQVSTEVLQAAVALAREQKGPAAKIPPNYLLPIVDKLLNPPAAPAHGRPVQSAPPAPPRKPQGNEPKGTDESYEDWQARVDAYERAQRNGGKAA